MTYTVARYGWRRDLPDQRDRPFAPPSLMLAKLPPRLSLRDGMPPVYDQGQLGSCTANAIAAQFDFARAQQGEDFITPSRLMIYYNERVMEHSVPSDSGAMGRDGIKSLKRFGVCPEREWKYHITKFAEKPPATCYADARRYQALEYARVNHRQLPLIRAAIAAHQPISFGFTVYTSFESDEVARTGIMPMPGPHEEVVGGHETLIVGYDDERRRVEVRNSWGKGWGDDGYFWMPYRYLTGPLCSDFWVIDKVT